MIKKYLLLAFLCYGGKFCAQNSRPIGSDTLHGKDYDYLFDRIEMTAEDKGAQAHYLYYFLNKAKSEGNSEETVNGYKNYLHYASDGLKLVYADSMIYAARLSKDNSLIGSAYLSKGIVYYGQKKHKYALDNYLIADNYISRTQDQYLIHKIKYNIGSIKYYLGFYDEAISLFAECRDFFRKKNERAYLNSLHLLGLCYNRVGNFGLCSEINELGIREGNRLENDEMHYYFVHSEGINEYFKKNYASAIQKINQSLPAINGNKDFANMSVGYFYLGKCYWDLRKPDRALPYLMKVDRIFEDRQYIRPDLRENYELIIKYYKARKDLPRQLFYIEKLLKADSVLDNNFRYLSTRVRKVYDTNLLLKDKKQIEDSFNKRRYNDLIFAGIAVFFLVVILFIAYRHIRSRNLYRRKFEELMKQNGSAGREEARIVSQGIDDISKDTVALVLRQLEKFEREKKFLEKDLTTAKLAAVFNSNPKYLSKIIYHFRGKKFTTYIADLKIDYIISVLKQDQKVRRYSNGALAEEAGFTTTQRFANAFFARAGCPTSYFIGELNKMSE